MSTTSKSPKRRAGGQKLCIFCEQGDVCEETYGKLLSKGGVTAHYFCMLFSSGLSQGGKSDKQGILGFLQEDITKEARRGARLRCSYCRKVGATIGCVIRNCKKMFHLGCGRSNNTMHQFFGTFSSFCITHRPQQDVPSDDDPNIVCSICLNSVHAQPANDALRSPCCRKYWYHRDCIQRYATSAGLHFFKCPLCNNKDAFQDEMLTMGVYIPDQDASWEKEPHAYQELLERYAHCDAVVCMCAEGRKYDKEASKWEIILCYFCGSHGAHVACNHMGKLGKSDICYSCKDINIKMGGQERTVKSPPHKRKSLELLQLELASSPDSSKTASPYPGPSNSMRKQGLPNLLQYSPHVASRNLTKTKNDRRLASPTWSPPKLKRQKKYCRASETVSLATANSHRGESAFLSRKHSSSQSSDESTGDDLPFSLLKNNPKKMKLENAWDCRRRKRNELQKKHAERKRKSTKIVHESGSEIEIKRKVVFGKRKNVIQSDTESNTATALKQKKLVVKQKKDAELCTEVKQNVHKKRKNIALDMETESAKEGNILSGQHTRYKSNDRLSLAVTNMEKGNLSLKEKGKQSRLSLKMSFPNIESKKRLHGKSKKSSENDRSQTTLTSWLKPMPKESKMSVDKGEAKCSTKPTAKQTVKKPIVIEWRGKQLLIKSPRVLLKRNKMNKMDILKPKNLEIDMNDRGSCDWVNGIDLLFNMDTDVRVTRQMVDIDHSAGDGKPRSRSASPLKDGLKTENSAGNFASSSGKVQRTENSPRKTSKSLLEVKYTENAVTKTEFLLNTRLTISELEPTVQKVTKNVENSELLGNVGDKLATVETVIDNVNRQCTVCQTDSPAKNLRARKTRDESSLTADNASVIETNGHSVADSGSAQFAICQGQDSPAKNLRARNTREETNVPGDMVQKAVVPTATSLTEFRNTPCKDNVHFTTNNHPNAKVSTLEIDSPAKNLRLCIKQDEQKPASVISDTSNEESIEKENQHTPTMKKKCSFQFNVTVKEIINKCVDESFQPENGTSSVHVKESAEFGSVTLENTYSELERLSNGHSTENNLEKLKKYKPVLTVATDLDDSPSKNLRKKLNYQTDHGSVTDSCSESERLSKSVITNPDSKVDIAKPDQLERLKKYRPKFKYAFSYYEANSQLENTVKITDIPQMKTIETEVAVSKSPKDTSKQSNDSEEMMQNSVVWHFEGTRQLDENPPISRNPAGMLGGKTNDTCENTCPIPRPIANGEGKVNSSRRTTPARKTFSMSDVLGERLNELQDNFSSTLPDYAISDELCNSAKGLGPSDFTKFRRAFSRSDSLETFSAPKITVDNGTVIAKTTSLEQGVPQIKRKGNISYGKKNCSSVKLRSSPRPSETSLSTPVHNHLSDKMLMTEYYACSEVPEPKQKKAATL